MVSGTTCGQCYITLDKLQARLSLPNMIHSIYQLQSRELHTTTPPHHIGQRRYEIMQNSTGVSAIKKNTHFDPINPNSNPRNPKITRHNEIQRPRNNMPIRLDPTKQKQTIQQTTRVVSLRIKKIAGTHWRCSGETSHAPEHVEFPKCSDRIADSYSDLSTQNPSSYTQRPQ